MERIINTITAATRRGWPITTPTKTTLKPSANHPLCEERDPHFIFPNAMWQAVTFLLTLVLQSRQPTMRTQMPVGDMVLAAMVVRLGAVGDGRVAQR